MRDPAPTSTRSPKAIVSVTPLTVDLTNHAALDGVRSWVGPGVNGSRLAGIGMTSARTRDRLVQRLQEQGITNLAVLDRIRNVPRHIFVDEALVVPRLRRHRAADRISARPSRSRTSSRA